MELLPHPAWMTRFPYNLTLARRDIRATPAQVEAFRRYAGIGDPLADAVVVMMRERPHTRRLFEQAVEEGIGAVADAPRPLVELFAQIDAEPYWLDRKQLAHGARVVGRSGMLGALVLGHLALMGGYLASRADKTLVRTGDLDSMAPRRLAETAAWWVDVTSPDGLSRYGKGTKDTLRVRIMHAQVRTMMAKRDDWNHAEWDHPVNQVQLAGTLLLFSLAFLTGARVLGVQFSPKDREAVLHLWRYVGHLVGVAPELLPMTEKDAWRLFWLEGATEFQPDEDSQRLAQALLAAGPTLLLRGRWQYVPYARSALVNYGASYSRIVLGKQNADFLGLPDTRLFQAAVLATGALNFALETARRTTPGATRVWERLGHTTRSRAVRRLVRHAAGDETYSRIR